MNLARLVASTLSSWLVTSMIPAPVASSGHGVPTSSVSPHRWPTSPRYANEWSSAGFINELPAEFFKVPVLWVHGHTHDSFDYQVGNCRVVCNPRGYVAWTGKVENREFDAGFVVVV